MGEIFHHQHYNGSNNISLTVGDDNVDKYSRCGL